MKKLILILVAVASLAACKNEDKKSPGDLSEAQRRDAMKDSSSFTSIQWLDSTNRDMGTVKEGTKVEVSFRFKNTGSHNLIFSNVSASCGCTTPDWPKRPIPPGQEDVIKAVFDSEHRVGTNNKEVYITANTLPQTNMSVGFKVEVTNK